MAAIVDAKFMTSAPSIKAAPEATGFNEVAFMGRSNVGKSSLLNALTNRKGLAKSSSTPGKTQLINFFDITFKEADEKFESRFVDLPGFGYAKVSKSLKSEWQKSLTNFIEKRETLKIFVHLIDARHPNLDIDNSVRQHLESIIRPGQVILEVVTKMDKLNQKEKNALMKVLPHALYVSNTKKSGVDKLKDLIFDILYVEPENDLL
jgi:GTP-binding protein